MKYLTLILGLMLVISAQAASAASLKNQLDKHASPYLAMHGADPVAWQEWNSQTVNRAKKEGKLIFVSSGYFSCHWCHVMQRESYKNAQVAKILNANFIPVKVDREINSALDNRLIDFVERTQGQAGWPLNVFITPQGYPLVGMTYVPTENFISILDNLTKRWKEEKPLLNSIAISATKELASVEQVSSGKPATGVGQDYIKRFLTQAKTMSDDMSGGFGDQNKFPSVPQLNAMLIVYENQPESGLKQFLELTLNKMASQGLNDQLGGGFFRYTVDPTWQVPHFEKMLYDNALLASLYLDAARILKHQRYNQVAKDTLDFLYSTFRSDKGAFIASLSAVDNHNVEGGYYLWDRDNLKKWLSADEMAVVELIWQLEGNDDLEGGHHLVEVMPIIDVASSLKLSENKAKQLFNSAKKKMRILRKRRIVPRDDKLLAAWNALTLSAYAKAAKQLDSPHYAKVAEDIKIYIYSYLWQNNKLLRAVKDDKVLGEGGLEDYAYLVQGISDWLDYSDNKADREWLNELINQAWARFFGSHGWLLSENSLLKYGEGVAVVLDDVLPSSSAVLINKTIKHADKTNNKQLKQKALAALNLGHVDLVSQPFWYSSQILALFDLQKSD